MSMQYNQKHVLYICVCVAFVFVFFLFVCFFVFYMTAIYMPEYTVRVAYFEID